MKLTIAQVYARSVFCNVIYLYLLWLNFRDFL